MSRLGGIDDERSCVADVGLVAENVDGLDEFALLLFRAVEFKGEDSAGAFRKVLISESLIFAACGVRVADPVDVLVCLKILDDLDCGRRASRCREG